LYRKWHIKATHNVYISQHNGVIEKENQNLDGVLFKMLHSQFWKKKKIWVKVLAKYYSRSLKSNTPTKATWRGKFLVKFMV
jgi:uncharacterized FlgJ-related protein